MGLCAVHKAECPSEGEIDGEEAGEGKGRNYPTDLPVATKRMPLHTTPRANKNTTPA